MELSVRAQCVPTPTCITYSFICDRRKIKCNKICWRGKKNKKNVTDTALRSTCLEVCHVCQDEKHYTAFHVNYYILRKFRIYLYQEYFQRHRPAILVVLELLYFVLQLWRELNFTPHTYTQRVVRCIKQPCNSGIDRQV